MDFTLTADQRELVTNLAELAQREFADRAFKEQGVPHENLHRLHSLGYLGMCMPESVGGGGRPWIDGILAVETLARYCPRTAYYFSAVDVGPASFIARLGSPELQERFLPGVMRGDEFVRISITEPEAGSDATAMRTSARVEGGNVVINGGKIFCSHADIATAYIVYVRFGPETSDIGCVVVPRDAAGLIVSPPDTYMSGAHHCALTFEDCTVPVENILIREDAFRRLMGQYSVERCGGAARALGISQLAINMTVTYMKERKQFGTRLADFQGLQWILADMNIQLDASRLLVYRAMTQTKEGFPSRYNSSVAKVHAAETSRFITDNAIQIHGGMGFDSSMPLEWLYRQVRGLSIAGGTVQVHRNSIAKVVLAGGKP